MKLTTLREAFSQVIPEGSNQVARAALWHSFLAGAQMAETGRITRDLAEICSRPMLSLPAAAVARQYARVKAIFGNKADAWMRLVNLAAAGDAGLTHLEMFGPQNNWTTILKYQRAGLLTVHHPKDRRRAASIIITAKGLLLLRMEKGGGHSARITAKGLAPSAFNQDIQEVAAS